MRIWYCPNCGYEVGGRGRCHSCRERLVASDLPSLESGAEDDEVGYRLDDWADRDRGRLIEELNELGILHRFEDDELVVRAEDEARVDDLVADLAATAVGDVAGAELTEGDVLPPDDTTLDLLRLLADAAQRLRRDPTDMQADADVAEASTAVFLTDAFYGTDDETWAAVGRVTRRLLGALGADEALEGEISSQAGVLEKLLAPLLEALPGSDALASAPETPVAAQAHDDVGDSGAADESARDGDDEEDDDDRHADGDGDPSAPDRAGETVYELPEWLPEQRAELGILLEDRGIRYEWDGPDLVVPADREAEVEELFGHVGGVTDDDDGDGEGRYHVLEELFAAAGRLSNDPTNEQRIADVMDWVGDVGGSPPIGMDEVYWFRITSHARALAEAIDGEGDEDVIAVEATALHELLRSVV